MKQLVWIIIAVVWITMAVLKFEWMRRGGGGGWNLVLVALAELAVGVMLWFPNTRPVGLVASLTILMSFSLHQTYYRDEYCDCLGLVSASFTQRNILIMALAGATLYAAFADRSLHLSITRGKTTRTALILVTIVTLGLLLLAIMATVPKQSKAPG